MSPVSRWIRTVIFVVSSCLWTGACGLTSDLPELDAKDFRPRRTPQTSKLYDASGRLITTFHGARNRTVVEIEEVARHVQEAIIAIEDERFYDHEGIDLRGIARAVIHNVSSPDAMQGGSTITQQYVKNRIIAPDKGRAPNTLKRKVDEAALARQLEKRLSKKEILERYLNTVYFGNGAYGIQAASETYFGKPAKKLTIKQAATLAGVIRTPETYDPYDHPRRAKKRRNVVIRKMEELGYLSRRAADRITSYPLGLRKNPRKKRHDAGYFVDYVRRQLVHHPRFSFLGKTPGERSDRLFSGGLRIHTTLHRGAQRAAERAIQRVLTKKNDPHAALVAIEPSTGHVVALVGGRDYFSGGPHAKLNLAIAGRERLGRSSSGKQAPGTGRQAGSAFKTFALAAAIRNGVPIVRQLPGPACAEHPDPNRDEPWKVCNYGGARYGKVSLREATVNSINTAYAKLILDVGPRRAMKMARRLGVRSDLLAVPSAVLGTNPVNPLGMATAYATLAAQGVRTKPVAITKITTVDGEVLYSESGVTKRVLDRGSAYLTTTLLREALERGTGTAARLSRPAAGKTGTAQEYRDAWFAGYTPNLAAAVWVGYPQGSISMKTTCSQGRSKCIPTRIQVTGGSWPAEIWRNFMSVAVKKLDLPPKDFRRPDRHLSWVTVDIRTGCLASAKTPTKAKERAQVPSSAKPPADAPRCKKQRAQDRERSRQRDEDRSERDTDRHDGRRSRGDEPNDEERHEEDERDPIIEPTPRPVPSEEPQPEPSEEPHPEPSEEPDPEPSNEPDPEPTGDPDPEPSPSPSPSP